MYIVRRQASITKAGHLVIGLRSASIRGKRGQSLKGDIIVYHINFLFTVFVLKSAYKIYLKTNI